MQINSKLLAFDIETAEAAQDDKIIPITVASTVTSDGEERAWFSHPSDKSIHGMTSKGADETWANFSPDGKLNPLMSKETAQAMLHYMNQKVKQGYTLCAWNGAGFDLKMIGHLAEQVELAGTLTMGLLDPMYQVLTMKGYPIGLSAVQKGLKIAQAKSMDGKDAPEAWKNGEFQKCIQYVVGDSQITIQVMQAIAKADGINWTAKSGKPNGVTFIKFKNIAECLLDPNPNNAWMDKPIDRHKIIAWIPASVRDKSTSKVEKEKSKVTTGELSGFKPVLLIVSGPSGAGKSVLCEELTRTMPSIKRSMTVTTRQPRKGEVDGVDYKFTTIEQFNKMSAAGEFLEQAEVFGNHYGSYKLDVSQKLANGEDVIMIVDVQGAAKIREFFANLPEKTRNRFRFADVFIAPPSMDELKNRLVNRGKDDMATIEKRIAQASIEMAQAPNYKYTIVNDDMNKAWDRLRSILVAERSLS